ncbi:hypothetical protein BAE44_0025645 [Dichanthelium oligosanthes]|uniref:Uncharacterized protein n=1 Tax=Dichanthelium oligosanthes TaxID=888268 RepID=A0A1E5UKC0_9POAL|nr:hypothetical protein BAE44_0025645 [Dichanthelium oligosanthes]
MADPVTMNKPEILEEDVVVVAELVPCTTTMGRINNLYFWAKMTDSNKGWHSEWFYVANPPLPLLRFSGHFAQKIEEWEWVTGKDEKKAWIWPMLVLLRELKDAGLTGVKVLWTFFERRLQPLMARARPLFRYAGADDLMRTSPESLMPVEVRSRVWAVIKRAKNVEDNVVELDRREAGLTPEPVDRRAAPSLGHIPGQSGDAPTSVVETPQDVAPTMTEDVGPAQLNPEVDPREAMVTQLIACPTPIVTLATPPPVLLGPDGSATNLATVSTVAAEAGTLAGLEETPDAGVAPHSEPLAEEVPPGGATMGETEVLDLTGDASEEEDVAAMLEAVMEEEVVEETDPERSVVLPDEAVPGVIDLERSGALPDEAAPEAMDPERSEALPDEAAPEAGARDVPPEEVPHMTATTSVAPTATTSEETPDAMAQVMDAADAPTLPLSGATAQDETEVAA